MLNKIFFLILCFLFMEGLQAQVEKTVIVEHFTNTRCGICASRNPDFFENLNNHPNVLHLAVHPSSPYSTCLLNNNNPAENDARTNYYGIYGSTPKLVVQGEQVSVSQNYGDAAIFASYLNQSSPASISITQSKNESTISVSVTITTEAENDLGDLQLYVAVAEDTVFYEAPNGEDLHFNVLRKRLSAENGTALNLPTEVGSSLTFDYSFSEIVDWEIDRLFTTVILQEAGNKSVVQSAATTPEQNDVVINSISATEHLQGVQIFPNPTSGIVQVSLLSDLETYFTLSDISGKIWRRATFFNQTDLDLSTLQAGIYFVELKNEQGRAIQKIVKE